MSNELKLMKLESRIALLKERGETMNARIIAKQERKRRALKAKMSQK